MQLVYKEGPVDYSTYTFNYQPWIIREPSDNLDDIYQQGGLPYSENCAQVEDHFYIARSLRIDLDAFTLSSENRRLFKKNAELPLHIELIEKSHMINSSEFLTFCEQYASQRFSTNSMTKERVKYALNKSFLTHILEFSHPDGTYGYVYLVLGEKTVHYWFAFLETETMYDLSLGKWLMTQTIQYAKDQGFKYIYLGTCYQEKSLYKVRDFNGIEYFTGQGRSNDKKQLKELCKNDSKNI